MAVGPPRRAILWGNGDFPRWSSLPRNNLFAPEALSDDDRGAELRQVAVVGLLRRHRRELVSHGEARVLRVRVGCVPVASTKHVLELLVRAWSAPARAARAENPECTPECAPEPGAPEVRGERARALRCNSGRRPRTKAFREPRIGLVQRHGHRRAADGEHRAGAGPPARAGRQPGPDAEAEGGILVT